jgi:hypothetical protein
MAREAQRDPAGLSGGARHALLAGLIDHAALFPPASLPLDAAVEIDRAACERPEAWMLGRFVVPASKLGELPEGFERSLSVVLDLGELPSLDGFAVERVEARLEAAPALADVSGPERFLEVWPGHEDELDAVAAAGASAKVRCGGATPDMFPSPGELAAFVVGCRDRGLRFKATAGLHHPIRDGIVHGFLNLLGAAVLAHAEGAGERELAEVLLEDDAGAFEVSGEAFAVHGREHGAAAVAAARAELFAGYGSCSFSEPVEDLHRLRMI